MLESKHVCLACACCSLRSVDLNHNSTAELFQYCKRKRRRKNKGVAPPCRPSRAISTTLAWNTSDVKHLLTFMSWERSGWMEEHYVQRWPESPVEERPLPVPRGSSERAPWSLQPARIPSAVSSIPFDSCVKPPSLRWINCRKWGEVRKFEAAYVVGVLYQSPFLFLSSHVDAEVRSVQFVLPESTWPVPPIRKRPALYWKYNNIIHTTLHKTFGTLSIFWY